MQKKRVEYNLKLQWRKEVGQLLARGSFEYIFRGWGEGRGCDEYVEYHSDLGVNAFTINNLILAFHHSPTL